MSNDFSQVEKVDNLTISVLFPLYISLPLSGKNCVNISL